jgi:DNA polymerase-3 subunit delta'
MGKHRFARALAQSLLCADAGELGRPCGVCPGCRAFLAGSHPDYHLVAPEVDSKSGEIKVDAVRELIGREVLTSSSGGYKVILIDPADRLNRAAANSLLKTLEEPVPNTLMLLLTAAPHGLPATVRSRCQRLDFGVAERGAARAWLGQQGEYPEPELLLDLAGGAPLMALDLARSGALEERREMLQDWFGIHAGRLDPLPVAERWAGLDGGRVLGWLAGWLIDSLRLAQGAAAPRLFNPDQRQALQRIGEGLDCRRLFRLLDLVLEARAALASTLNRQLMLEQILITWAEFGSD